MRLNVRAKLRDGVEIKSGKTFVYLLNGRQLFVLKPFSIKEQMGGAYALRYAVMKGKEIIFSCPMTDLDVHFGLVKMGLESAWEVEYA